MFAGRKIDFYYEDGELINTNQTYYRMPEANNSSNIDTSAGNSMVIHEPNPRPAIDNITVDPVVITRLPKENEAAVKITFRVNRSVEVTYGVDSPWYQSFQSQPIKLEPGIHTVQWNGRDDQGNEMPMSEYRVCFQVYEENSSHPDDQRVKNLCSPKFLYWPKTIHIPESRFREVVGNISLKTGVSETLTGAVTLSQGAELGVYIADGIGQKVMNVLESDAREAGTYTFQWDAKDYYGYFVPSGKYYIGISLTEGDKRQDYVFHEKSFTVNGMQKYKPLTPARNVTITADYAKVRLCSGSQVMTFKGAVYPIVEYTPKGSCESEYLVLMADGVPGYIKVSDTEWMEPKQHS